MQAAAGKVESGYLRTALLAAPFVAVVAYLLWETREQTFYADEWFFFSHAAGWDPGWLARPDQGNLVAGATLVYKLTLAIGGAENHLYLRLVWIALDLICAGLFFLLMRRRVGLLAAYVPALVLVVFGASWEMFGGSLGINVLTSVAAGLGAVLALERGSRRADAFACLLLTFSVVAHSTGLAILAGVITAVLIRSDRWRRVWIVAIPLVLYGTWWIWARKFGESSVNLETIASAPATAVALFASATASMAGAFRLPGPHDPSTPEVVILVNQQPGLLLGALLAVAVGWRLRSIQLEWRLLPPVVALLAYWASLALVSPAREPGTGRYQYASAMFILFILAELWRGWRPSRAAAVAIVGIGAVSIVPNVINLHYAADFMRHVSIQDKAKLAIVEDRRGRFDPETIIEPSPINIERDLATSATSYFKGIDEFGSPAFSLEELPTLPASARLAADQELVYLLQLDVVAVESGSSGPGCRSLPPEAIATGGGFAAPAGGVAFRLPAGGEANVGVRRYGDDFFQLRAASGGGWFEVPIPVDDIAQPWYVAIESPDPVQVCPLRGSGRG
jgi:hypothetical protein